MNLNLYSRTLLRTIFLCLLSISASQAQVTITSNDTTICAGNSVTLNASYAGRTPNLINLPDDQFSPVIPISFPFSFYGATYSHCIISSNGYISFDTLKAGQICNWRVWGPLPNGSNADLAYSIMPGFADLFPNNAGDIDWAIVGTAPNRKFVVTWCNMPFYQCTANFVAMQAVLYEGTNVIDLQLNRKDNCNSGSYGTFSGYTIQGLQNDFTTADIVPGRNATFWSAIQDGHRFTPTGTGGYTITTIPYAFISRAAWYENNTNFISAANTITVTPLSTTFYVYKTDCADIFADTVTVTVLQTPNLGISSIANPTTCAGTNGSITINGLTANTAYSLAYTVNGSTNVVVPITSNTFGRYTIAGLAAGVYSNIAVTINSCPSATTGPVTLTDPPLPPAPIPTATPNALCAGSNLSLSTPAFGGLTYAWTGPNGFTAATAATSISNITTAGTGNYSVTALSTATQCRSLAGVVAVTVNPLPIISSVTPANPITCSGANGSISLLGLVAGTSYTITYSKNGAVQPNVTVVADASGAAKITGLTAGTYNNFIAANPNCTSSVFTNSFTLVDPPLPVVTVGSQTDVACFGGATGSATIATTGTAPYTYVWSPTGGTGATATGLIAGTYVVTVKDANLCSQNRSLTITQPNAPLATVTTTNSPVCAFSNLVLSSNVAGGTAPYTYAWTGPASFTATTATATRTSVATNAAGTYTLVVTDAKGCTASGTSAVVVNTVPPQPGTISGTANICGGATMTYRISSVATATSYLWTLPPGWTATSAAGLDSIRAVAPNVASTGTLSVVAVNGCGSSIAQNLSLIVTTIPGTPSPIIGNPVVCGGVERTYSVIPESQPTSYTWTVPTGWSAPNSVNYTMNTIPTTTISSGTITVTATNSCGTSPARSLAVAVTGSIPVQPAAIMGNTAICGGTAQVYRIPRIANAGVYTWTVAGSGWTTTGAATDTFVNATAGTADITISVVATNGCGTSPARTQLITVSNRPGAAGIISGPDSICTSAGSAIFSTGLINEATSYIWTQPTGWTGTSTTGILTTVPGTTTGAVTFTVAGTNACGTGITSQKIVIVSRPVTPSVTISTPTGNFCAGDSVAYQATGTNGGSTPLYQWKINGVNIGAASSATIFRTRALNNGDVVSVTLKSSLPCPTTPNGYAMATAPAIVIIPRVMPGANINATTPPNMCKDLVVTFYANTTGAGTAPTYQWKRNGIDLPGATGVNYTMNNLANGDSISVVLTSNALCRLVDSVSSNKIGVSVSPYATPVVTISANPGTTIGAGRTVIFTANATNAGANPEVRWKKNGNVVSATTGLTWTTSSLRDGDVIEAELVSGAQCATPFIVESVNRLVMNISTGISSSVNNTIGSISLYPNPNTGKFTVRVQGVSNGNGKRIKLEVLNAIGQRVYTNTVQPNTKDWTTEVRLDDGVANGVYVLKVGPEEVQSSNEQPAAIRFQLNR